jgi:hypothetical protein
MLLFEATFEVRLSNEEPVIQRSGVSMPDSGNDKHRSFKLIKLTGVFDDLKD